jgi:CBS domain-containing protein
MSTKPALTRIQELVYEVKIGEVMTHSVVTVTPQTCMSELREVLRDNRISGAPVVSEGRLARIISIEDFINWVMSGPRNATVGDRMIRDVAVAYDDEPLVQAVSKLDRHGYGQLPIVQRDEGNLVGILTNGDIIAGLLRKLEIGYHEEEIRCFGASHIFDDILADKIALMLRYRVIGQDFRKAGSGATHLKKTLRRLGIHPRVLRRIAIIAYEAEMNMVIYTDGGELLAKVCGGMGLWNKTLLFMGRTIEKFPL